MRCLLLLVHPTASLGRFVIIVGGEEKKTLALCIINVSNQQLGKYNLVYLIRNDPRFVCHFHCFETKREKRKKYREKITTASL